MNVPRTHIDTQTYKNTNVLLLKLQSLKSKYYLLLAPNTFNSMHYTPLQTSRWDMAQLILNFSKVQAEDT